MSGERGAEGRPGGSDGAVGERTDRISEFLEQAWSESHGSWHANVSSGSSRRASEGRFLARAVKRLLDAVLAAALLVLLLPLIAVLALAVKLDSAGPILYRSRRVGFRGEELNVLKFRKMVSNATGPALTLADDERFTRLGRFLAISKLDELPQLWNVLRGEMSLVGPRPEDLHFVAHQRGAYEHILQAKPGITGLSQIAFAKESRILDSNDMVGAYVQTLLPAKIRMDKLYASSWSVGMDLRILLWTAVTVLLRRDVAVCRTTGRMNLRRRARQAEPMAAPIEEGGLL